MPITKHENKTNESVETNHRSNSKCYSFLSIEVRARIVHVCECSAHALPLPALSMSTLEPADSDTILTKTVAADDNVILPHAVDLKKKKETMFTICMYNRWK